MLATPYFQVRLDRVPSTQDVARARFVDLPLLVIASAQTAGRGRSGAMWENADVSLAASLVFGHEPRDSRPLSLMAGVAAHRVARGTLLKWPNDLLIDADKVGGILVERDDRTTTIGLGLDLWWEDPPEGVGALFASSPGPSAAAELGAVWGAELWELISGDGWPIDEYRKNCLTLGREVTWQPRGSGRAMDVAEDGALLVETSVGLETLYSGEVTHVRAHGERPSRS